MLRMQSSYWCLISRWLYSWAKQEQDRVLEKEQQVQGVTWIQIMVTDDWMKWICQLSLLCFEPRFQDPQVLCQSSTTDTVILLLQDDLDIKITCGSLLATCGVVVPSIEEGKLPLQRDLRAQKQRISLLPRSRAPKQERATSGGQW